MEIIYKDCPTCQQVTREVAGFSVYTSLLVSLADVQKIIYSLPTKSTLGHITELCVLYPGLLAGDAKNIIEAAKAIRP